MMPLGHTFDELLAWSQDIVMLYPLDELCTPDYTKHLDQFSDIMKACTCEEFAHHFYCPHSLLFTMAHQDSLNSLDPEKHAKRGRDRCPIKFDTRKHQSEEGHLAADISAVGRPPSTEDCYGRPKQGK